ncbi:MAG TPA: response regulator transcription factor [Clostridiaceae bacterium]|jgi:two-component system alkaline phosphatase synthesis response regulator PhoP|nr:response regulator transcription factor [Clostridiaceae bacterium]
MRKILIVDDEEKIRELIRMNLELAGYKCDEAEDGEIALEKLNKFSPDLALLDIMLPKKNGYEIAQSFIKQNVPIIFLTAKDSVTDKVKGLKLGADDYIVKPFESMELLARIEVVLRRTGKFSDIFEYRNIKVDFAKREVFKNNEKIEMTAQEFELLKVLIQNKNLALSREKLLESAWGYDYYGDTRTVDMHIQRLRKKLSWDDIIVTVYKYGYRLEI